MQRVMVHLEEDEWGVGWKRGDVGMHAKGRVGHVERRRCTDIVSKSTEGLAKMMTAGVRVTVFEGAGLTASEKEDGDDAAMYEHGTRHPELHRSSSKQQARCLGRRPKSYYTSVTLSTKKRRPQKLAIN